MSLQVYIFNYGMLLRSLPAGLWREEAGECVQASCGMRRAEEYMSKIIIFFDGSQRKMVVRLMELSG